MRLINDIKTCLINDVCMSQKVNSYKILRKHLHGRLLKYNYMLVIYLHISNHNHDVLFTYLIISLITLQFSHNIEKFEI